jgi:uncharacterized protein (TIGR00730 family)
MVRPGMRSICVFCGSSLGRNPIYRTVAARVGTLVASRGLRLVYGGANLGLMGVLADAALSAGGEVIGVIPESLVAREIGHVGITELRVVASMHERKAQMADLSDGFIALPGAFGTLEEYCEILTWAQLGIHGKPCGLLDVAGYWSSLIRLFDHAVAEGFLHPDLRALVIEDDDSERLLARMERYMPPETTKWIAPDER